MNEMRVSFSACCKLLMLSQLHQRKYFNLLLLLQCGLDKKKVSNGIKKFIQKSKSYFSCCV